MSLQCLDWKVVRIYPWLIIFVALVLAAIQLAPSTSPVADHTAGRDGMVTFQGPGYRFRVRPEQLATVIASQIAELSIDRRQFGSPETPGPPRVSCTPDGTCQDICEGTATFTPGCPDIKNGWYRLTIIPTSSHWGGVGLRELPRRNAGPVFSCGDDGHLGLEICWDPVRIAPNWPVANVHEVPQSAIDQWAAMLWVSI